MSHQTELYKFLSQSKNANLTAFFAQYTDSFKKWHKSAFTVDEFLEFWEKEFTSIYKNIYGKNIKVSNPPSRRRLELCTEIVHSINVQINKRQLKRTLEVEDLELQNSLAQSSFKHLRRTVEQGSSQSSAPSDSESYNPNSTPEVSEVDETQLEPFWLISRVNMSKHLNSFRSRCIKKMCIAELSSMEKMSVNHVFLITDVMEYLGLSAVVEEALLESLGRNEGFEHLGQEDSQAILEISNAAIVSLRPDEVKIKATVNLSANPSSSCLKTVSSIVDNLARDDLDSVDESLFIRAVVDPVIDNAIDYRHLVKAGHFTELEGSSKIRPDIKYSYSLPNGQNVDLLAIEVKSPGRVVGDDLFKLSVELQLMVNRLVEAGVDFPEVYGVVIQGYSCCSYKMDLTGPMVYRMVILKSFYLPRSLGDLSTLLDAIASVRQLNSLLVKQVSLLSKTSAHNISSTNEWIRLPVIATE